MWADEQGPPCFSLNTFGFIASKAARSTVGKPSSLTASDISLESHSSISSGSPLCSLCEQVSFTFHKAAHRMCVRRDGALTGPSLSHSQHPFPFPGDSAYLADAAAPQQPSKRGSCRSEVSPHTIGAEQDNRLPLLYPLLLHCQVCNHLFLQFHTVASLN